MWGYVITAMVSMFIGFITCALLSANKYDQEFTFDDLLESEEDDE